MLWKWVMDVEPPTMDEYERKAGKRIYDVDLDFPEMYEAISMGVRRVLKHTPLRIT